MCADLRRYAQLQPFTLAGSGAIVGATSIILTSFQSIDGVDLTMAAFGTKGFITLEPGSLDKEEQISFTGITNNANGTVTLTGVNHVDFLYPYTESAGLQKSHGGGVTLVVSNTSGFYDGFTNKNDTETITQEWIFPSTEADRPKANADTDALAFEDYVTFGQLFRTAMAGTVNASEIVSGVVQLATNAQMGTGTSVGSTGARLVPPNDQLVKVSSGAADENKIPVLNSFGKLADGFQSVDQPRTWTTVQIFPPDDLQINADPNSADDATRKSYVDDGSSTNKGFGTSGEAFNAGQSLYFKAADGKLYKTTTGTGEQQQNFAGFSNVTVGAADLPVTYTKPGGVNASQAGLTIGETQFLGVAGAVTTTPPANAYPIGLAVSATSLLAKMGVRCAYFNLGGPAFDGGTSTFTTGFTPIMVVMVMLMNDGTVNGTVAGVYAADGSGQGINWKEGANTFTVTAGNFTKTSLDLTYSAVAGNPMRNGFAVAIG